MFTNCIIWNEFLKFLIKKNIFLKMLLDSQVLVVNYVRFNKTIVFICTITINYKYWLVLSIREENSD